MPIIKRAVPGYMMQIYVLRKQLSKFKFIKKKKRKKKRKEKYQGEINKTKSFRFFF